LHNFIYHFSGFRCCKFGKFWTKRFYVMIATYLFHLRFVTQLFVYEWQASYSKWCSSRKQ
jgi:hypothetical protein